VDRIVCANALNYIPTLAFARQAEHVTKDGGQLVFLNQTGAFNYSGVLSALEAANVGMAKERAMTALRQELVRLGFAGFMPSRSTPTATELEAVLYAFGFQLVDDFVPTWERRLGTEPTFEGLVFARHSWIHATSLPDTFRPQYRKLLYQAGFPELDAELFPDHAADLSLPALAQLSARAGTAVTSELNPELTEELELGRLVQARAFLRVSDVIGRAGLSSPAHLLAGAVAALIEADTAGAKQHIQRLNPVDLPRGVFGLLDAMCHMLNGNSAHARSALEA
jgi:hypothetical protein